MESEGNAHTGAITLLLQGIERGDDGAADELFPRVYGELRDIARAQLQKLPGRTLQPTELVNEVYLRLLGDERPAWSNRRHFFFAVARAMHDLLIQNARKKARLKRGGDRQRVSLEGVTLATEAPAEVLLALEAALEALERENPDHHRLVELRFYAGLSMSETAQVLGKPLRTLEREWRYVRARLAYALGG